MQKAELYTRSFRVIDHSGQSGTWRVGYHCPSCGRFYATARYTLETDDVLLGSGMLTRCCGKELSLPRTFDSVEEITVFLKTLNRNTEGTKAVLIAKKHLIAARFRYDARGSGNPILN